MKKGLGAVVATSLLLVVTTLSIVGFSQFYNSFSQEKFAQVQTQENSQIKIESLVDNVLYIKSDSNYNLNSLKINNKNGDTICSFSGSGKVNETGLVSWWKFNDNSGIIKDYSGNGNDGKLFGDTRFLLDFNNETISDITSYNYSITDNGVYWLNNNCVNLGCVQFDGLNDRINFSPINLNFKSGSSINFYLKNFDNDSWQVILGNGESYNLVVTRNSPINTIYIESDINTDECYGYLNTPITNNTWSYISMVVKNYTCSFYQDGVKLNMADSTLTSNLTLSRIENDLNGSIDELSIYSKALSQEEINYLYDSKKAQFIEFKDSKVDQSVTFDGIDDFIEVNASSGDFDFNSNLTIISIFKPREIKSNRQHIVSRRNNVWGTFIDDSVNLYRFYARTFYWKSVNDPSINLGKYNLFVQYYSDQFYSSSLSNMYIQSSFSGTINTTTSNNPLYIGNDNNFNGPFEGEIEEIRIYNRTLSQEEIDQIKWNYLKQSNLKLNEIDLTSCNLQPNQRYQIIGSTNNQLFEAEVYVK